MESEVIFLFLLSLVYCMASIDGEVRCYCNESECISTGYMCKSAMGMCYSRWIYEGDITRTTQGCVDSLEAKQKQFCSDIGNMESKTQSASRDLPILLCCKKDMCNYKKDILDIDIIVSSRVNYTKLRPSETVQAPTNGQVPFSRTETERNSDSDLWFKAAVIAVPIAGGFILILLVLLAVRMLRSDTRRHRQLIQFRRERTSLTKAQLYVTDHFSKKTEKSSTSSSLFGEKHNTVCKDINIKVDKDGKVYEQVCEKTKTKRTQPSIIVWGKPTKNNFATVV